MGTRVSGEYWVTDGGDVLFADADIGPDGHETHVLAHARVLLLDMLGAGSIEEPADASEWRNLLAVELGIEAEAPHGSAWESAIRNRAIDLGREPDECLRLFGVALDMPGAEDPRDFAMREWGWIWVRGQNVACWTLAREDSRRLCKGLMLVLEEEGIDAPDAESAMEFSVRLGASGKRLETSIDALRSARPSLQPSAYDLDFPAKRMVDRMDREAMAPCYAHRCGD